jgi:hypothetical protein
LSNGRDVVLVWYWCGIGVVMVLMFGYSKKSVRMFIIYTLEDLKWDKMQFFRVYPFQENVNFDYVVSSNTTDEF